MYKIYADETLIYDSTVEDYKIGSGQISLETGKSGSFVFSLYPDHFYYDRFVKLKTVITVYKSGRIVFRGRVLNDITDYYNRKELTCEGELGFLQDSIIRPFEYTGDHKTLVRRFINEHNSQMDAFKQFKIGKITVEDDNSYVNRSSADYGSALATINSALVESALGGYLYITHGDDGTDPIPTINYVAGFTNAAKQNIEFGVNLKDYSKTTAAEDIATAIIPLGAETETSGQRLTVKDVNGGVDYVYNAAAVALRGWVFKTVVWEDVTLASNLKKKAENYLDYVVNQNLTVELNAIDLHLLDRSIESFNICDNVHVVSPPHKLDTILTCNKQTIDLLKPENDTITLGYVSSTFTEASTSMASSVSTLGKQVSSIKQDGTQIVLKVEDLSQNIGQTLRVGADGVTVTDANGNTVTIAGSQIDASSINTEQLDASRINVSDLNLSNAITWGDLDSNIRAEIEGAYDDAAEALSKANSANNAVSRWSYSGTTYIDSSMILVTSLRATELFGGTIGVLGSNGIAYGYLYAGTNTENTTAFEVYGSNGLRLIAAGNVYVAGSGNGHITISGEDVNVGPNLYLSNGTQITSDRDKKHDICYELDAYDAVFDALKPAIYKLNDGTSGRYHGGFIAQDVEEAILGAGLTTKDYAVFCRIPIYATDENGNPTEEIVDYTCSLRPDEIIPLNTREIQKLKKRVAELEAKIA